MFFLISQNCLIKKWLYRNTFRIVSWNLCTSHHLVENWTLLPASTLNSISCPRKKNVPFSVCRCTTVNLDRFSSLFFLPCELGWTFLGRVFLDVISVVSWGKTILSCRGGKKEKRDVRRQDEAARMPLTDLWRNQH